MRRHKDQIPSWTDVPLPLPPSKIVRRLSRVFLALLSARPRAGVCRTVTNVLDPETRIDGARQQLSFDRVYGAEYGPLLALALVLTGERGAAEDLVQETFYRLYRHWNRVSGYERPGAWLRRVLINLATSRRRRLVHEALALTRLRHSTPPREEPALSADEAGFWSAVRQLPRRRAQILTLYYAEDRPVADIAGILGLAEGTVRAHLHSGRQTLAARLQVETGTEDEET